MRPASSASGRNLIGGSSPSLGCGHRTQRLDRQDLTGAKVELRLVVQHEVALVDRRLAAPRARRIWSPSSSRSGS